jgi:hypothetical protein
MVYLLYDFSQTTIPGDEVGARLTAETLGFVALPPLNCLLLAVMLVCYAFLNQLVKTWFYSRFGP